MSFPPWPALVTATLRLAASTEVTSELVCTVMP